ncbi:MAG: protein translocase subunit SecD [Actinobacteria bacterium]|nr:protein translocase subunit SecD [Actinomycetota bacterium]
MKGKLIASLVVVLAIAGTSAGFLIAGATPQLGLDLRGGISAILSPVTQPGDEVDSDVLDQTIDVIRSRVDSLGVAEPEISRQGNDVLVQLPGLQDEERAREVIGRTAHLTFRPVEEIITPGTPAYDEAGTCDQLQETELPDDQGGVVCGEGTDPATGAPLESPTKYRVGAAALGGSQIDDAITVPGSGTHVQSGNVEQNWDVQLDLSGQGGSAFAEITGQLACERDQGRPGLLAIVLDNIVESAPAMNPEVACNTGITGGTAIITTNGGQEEAGDLALVLKTGALPITLEPSTFETVSPTLGRDSLDAGLLAGAIGLVIVAIYLTFFYRWLGLVAISALAIFGLLITGTMTLLGKLGFTLTLAGIAGVVVSIGITADSSIIYFERLRDEVSTGRTMRTAVQRAFSSAFRTNLAGNTVTLAAAIILYFLAVGPVRGFALTLGLSTVLDIVILYFFTRPTVTLMGRTRVLSASSVRAEQAAPVAGGSR